MRQRSIHSIAHWTIMTLLLLFPVLIVGVSIFGKESQTIDVTETYEYETNEVNSVDDLIVGNIYKFTIDSNNVETTTTDGFWLTASLTLKYETNISVSDFTFSYLNTSNYILTKRGNGYYLDVNLIQNVDNSHLTARYFLNPSYISDDYYVTCYFIFYSISNSTNILNYVSASDYLGEKTVDYVIHNQDYRQDINDWCSEFINLPVNGWYQSLMNVMGIGLTNNSVMNVIYVMPLYIVWVFILDLVVDIILVIVRLPHKALNKLGGENE